MIARVEKIAPAPPSHAEVFMGRYEGLFQHALRLTDHDREKAEDLLHDAFVQFNVSKPDLSEIADADAYLYVVLRHLHLSKLRQAKRNPIGSLLVVEYDSAEIGLRAVDHAERLAIEEQLRRVCAYACMRKETAKAGSALILRFFHGYYLDEISSLLRTSYSAVRELLRYARSEARVYIEEPDRLSILGAKRTEVKLNLNQSPSELLSDLRAAVFTSRRGSCLSSKRLNDIYLPADAAGPECSELAHLVSCRRCLDRANDLLGLMLLAERYPIDTLSKDNRKSGRPGGGDPPTGGSATREIRRYSRRVKEVTQHEPKKLFISVNGNIVGSQEISSEVMVQTANIQNPEPIGFIEIISEQKIRLLFMKVDVMPDGNAYQESSVQLSDGRSLEASLSLAEPWPVVRVIYRDPRLSTDRQTESQASAVAEPSSTTHKLTGKTARKRIWMRPVLAFTLATVLICVGVLGWRMWSRSMPSAVTLLSRAAATEQAVAANQVVHQTITLEERYLVTGNLISRERIEIWQHGQKQKARRVYNDAGQLIAGVWTRADGTTTTYTRGDKPELRTDTSTETEAALNVESPSQIDPSAGSFVGLGEGSGAPRDSEFAVSQNQAAYTVSFKAGSTGNGAQARLVRASLILNKADLHATEESLIISRGGEERLYRFVETSFERRPPSAVAPAVFEPDPEISAALGSKSSTSTSKPGVAAESLEPALAIASPELEVKVLSLLSGIGADLGQEVIVKKLPSGLLSLEAVVESEQRKREILAALQPVASKPALKIQIETAAEAEQRREQALGAAQGNEAEVTVGIEQALSSGMPAQAALRQYLAARGVQSSRLDAESDKLAAQIVAHSHRCMLQAWALKDVASRFSQDELNAMDTKSRDEWLKLIRLHASNYERESKSLQGELAGIFNVAAQTTGPGSQGKVVSGLTGDAGLIQSVRRLIDAATAADEAIRAEFTVGTKKTAGAGVSPSSILQRLSTAGGISAGIQGFQ